jgi:hypothetical protein
MPHREFTATRVGHVIGALADEDARRDRLGGSLGVDLRLPPPLGVSTASYRYLPVRRPRRPPTPPASFEQEKWVRFAKASLPVLSAFCFRVSEEFPAIREINRERFGVYPF